MPDQSGAPPSPPVPPRRSLVFPILLIIFGAIFLFAEFRPGFDPWPVLRTWWPLILIFLGAGKIWDSMHNRGSQARSGISVGSTIGIVAFAVVLIVIFWHGRSFTRERTAEAQQHETRTVDLQGAKSIQASINMGAGELTVRGGAAHLLEATFDYYPRARSPQVDYSVADGTGTLEVSQQGAGPNFRGDDNDWFLRFAKDIPMTLEIHMGAGHSDLNLRELDIGSLNVQMGAGQAEIDLTGDRKRDLTAEVHGGVGQAVIRLPRNVGVEVSAHGGIGSIDAGGLKEQDGRYVNDAFGKTPATIHLTINGGIGEIDLLQED